MNTVEVFCTDVQTSESAACILSLISNAHPSYNANFDLEDCDRILRVESTGPIETEKIIAIIQTCGYTISILPDTLGPF